MNINPSSKARSTASFLQAIFSLRSTHRNLWLGLSVLSLVYSSPVFAVMWLNQDYSNYTVGEQVSTANTPSLVTSLPAVNVVVDVSGNKKLQYNKPGASAGTATLYKLSDNLSTDRQQGYFSFRETIGTTVTGTSYLSYILAPNDTTATSAASTYLQIRFYNANPTSNQLRIYSGNGTSSPLQVWPTSGYLTLPAGENYFQVWYNKTATSMVFINPSGVSNTLPQYSFAVFVNGTFYGANANAANLYTGSLPVTVASSVSTIGRVGWQAGNSGQPYDVTFDNIYAGSYPALAIISPATALAASGSNFTYTIPTTAVPGSGVTFRTDPSTPLPPGLGLNQATGVISGVPTTADTYTITLIASAPGETDATATLTITVTAAPTVYRWNNLGTDWSSAGSWDNGTAPATSALIDTAQFGNLGSSATGVNVGSGKTIKGIVFNAGAYGYTWGGTDITVLNSGAITNDSTATQTFNNKVINDGGNASWSSSVAGGAMVFSGGIDLNSSGDTSRILTFTGAGNTTVSSVIANGGSAMAGAVTVTGTGATVLSGANMYDGLTTMNAAGGTLTLSGNNSGAAGGVTLTTGTLNINNANALGSGPVTLTAGTINNTSGAAIVNAGNNPVAWDGSLTYGTADSISSSSNLNLGTGVVTASASRTITLAGTGTKLTMGSVNITSTSTGRTLTANGAGNTLEMGGLTLSAHQSLAQVVKLAGSANFNITGPIANGSAFAHGVEVLATGTTTFSGVNTYGGSTTVSKLATLSIPTEGSLANCGPIVVASSSTDPVNSANLNLAGLAGVVQVGSNGVVRGGGSITSLQVQNATVPGMVEVALGSLWTTGGTIDFAAGSKVSVIGTPVSGETYILMTATGITGTPTLAATASTAGWGLRVIGSSIYLQEVGVITIGDGASETYSTANFITGLDSMTKRGTGTLILSAANDYTGGTFLEAGTLQIGNSFALGSITTAGSVTLKGGTLKSTVDLNLGRFVGGTPAIVGNAAYQAVYGANSRVPYSGVTTTINGPVTLNVGTDTTMTMGTLIGNSSPSSLVTKTGAGTVKLMGGTTKLNDAGMAVNGNASSVLGGWRIEAGTVWFGPSANNGAGNGPITLAGGDAKFSKLQNSNGTYTGFDVPSDLTLASSGLIQFDPDAVTLLGQNNLGFKNLSIGASTLEVATGTTSSVAGQVLPSVNFKSATLTGSATLNNPANLDLNLQAVSGLGGFTKIGLGTLYLSDQPNQAAAFVGTLTSTGGVVSINVEYAGSGYAVAPAAAPEVTVVPVNGGTGAAATATIDSNGRVTSIAVTAPGTGYLSLPRVVIAAPPTVATANSYTGATTVQEGKLNLSGSYASSVTVKPGAALQLDWLAPAQAECSVDAISPTSTTLNASYSYVKNLYLTKSVGGYVPSTSFEFDLPAPVRVDGSGTATGTATYVLAAARASATVDSDGFISALSIVNGRGGSGYALPPIVAIPAPTVPTVVATTTGSITFETGAQLSVNNPPIGTGASCTLLTADGGISGNPDLVNLPGYTLTKSGNSLILTDNREGPTFSANPTAAAISYGQSLAPSNLNSGSASVPGAFAWKNAGTLLPVGTSSQIVTFTPTDPILYRPAEFTVSVTVNKASLTPVFSGNSSPTYDGTEKSLSAATTPTTIVNLTYDGSATAPTSVGIYTVVATVIDANYEGSATTSLMISRADQMITFGSLPAKTYGDAPFNLAATTTSGLAVAYVSSNTSVATVSGNIVTIVGAGSTVITASQAGGANYNAAVAVPQTLTVNNAGQTITFASLSAKTYGDAPFNLAATTTSGLAVAYVSSNTSVATVSGNIVTIVGAGSTVITASQAGGDNYNAAVAVPQTLTVNPATPAGTTYSGWLSGGTASDAAFLDYVFGAVTPGTLPASLKPTVAVTGGNLVLTYYVRQGTLGLTVTTQARASLAAGSTDWSTDGVTDIAVGGPTTAINGVSVQQRTASVSASGGRMFLRAKAEQAP